MSLIMLGGVGGGSTGGGGGPSGAVDWDALYDAEMGDSKTPTDNVVWLNPTSGNDANAGSLKGLPKQSLAAALTTLDGFTGTGTVIWVDGSYAINQAAGQDTDQLLNSEYNTIPSGASRTDRNIFRAETPGGVKLTITGGNFFGGFIKPTVAENLWIDGFDVDDNIADGGDTDYQFRVGKENWVTRCGVIKRNLNNGYGGGFHAGGGASGRNFSLFQDCWFVGATRYGFQAGTGGSGVGYTCTFRRCVCRADYVDDIQPKAAFSHYGNNASGNDSKETMWADCIAIDGPDFGLVGGSAGWKWGSWYHPKDCDDIRHRNCFSVNEGFNFGAFRMDNVGTPSDHSWKHCAVLGPGNGGGSTTGYSKASAGTGDVENCFGSVDSQSGWTETDNTTTAQTYPTQQNVSGTGPEILYSWGANFSVWGETGHDAASTLRLWPFPYEDRIKELFSRTNAPPSGYTPTSNTATRGFCTGNSMDGSAQSLTKYIWEYNGNQIPDLETVY